MISPSDKKLMLKAIEHNIKNYKFRIRNSTRLSAKHKAEMQEKITQLIDLSYRMRHDEN